MKQAVIKSQGEWVEIQAPFDREFLDDMKAAVPNDARKWDAGAKVWLVKTEHADRVAEIARRYFDVVDGRDKSEAEIEDAQIEAELEAIKANQAYILENEARIEAEIKDLDARISRYSYGSKSRVRYGLAQDRALLQHSLTNARQGAESLTELQVRGLAAAVRYLRK